MNKLLLLLLVPSAVFAMNDAAPAVVRMNDDDAPSYFSKRTHQCCCRICCSTVLLIGETCAGQCKEQQNLQRCGDVYGCTYAEGIEFGLTRAFAASASLQIGQMLGQLVGAKTFAQDKKLKAKLIDFCARKADKEKYE
jgi:hypothetical protein